MLHLLLKISNYLECCRPEAVYNIRELSSSQAGFVVPDRCEAWLDNHLPPTAPIGEIMLEIEELLLQERQSNPQLDAALRFATIHAGYELPEKGPLVEALRTSYGHLALPWEPLPFRSHSDANLLWAACGINRPATGHRTVPSAMNSQEVDIYAALPDGLDDFIA